MKKYILIAVSTIVVLTALAVSYYYYVQHTSSAISVFVDVTDSSSTSIDTSEVPSFIMQTIASWSRADITFSTLSNFELNKSENIHIDAEFPLLANPNKRKLLMKAQMQKINKTLSSLHSDGGRTKSVLYVPIAKELNRLAKVTAKQKIAIFFTDALENSDYFSMYSASQKELLRAYPKKVRKLLEQQIEVSNLSGIDVYFIGNASTPEGEKDFLLMTSLWKDILEAHHARVVITTQLANTNFYAQ